MSNFIKIQIYMAASQEEYDEALKYVRDRNDVKDIREVGHMDTTGWLGEPMDTYVFLFSAPNSMMNELTTHMRLHFDNIGCVAL